MMRQIGMITRYGHHRSASRSPSFSLRLYFPQLQWQKAFLDVTLYLMIVIELFIKPRQFTRLYTVKSSIGCSFAAQHAGPFCATHAIYVALVLLVPIPNSASTAPSLVRSPISPHGEPLVYALQCRHQLGRHRDSVNTFTFPPLYRQRLYRWASIISTQLTLPPLTTAALIRPLCHI